MPPDAGHDQAADLEQMKQMLAELRQQHRQILQQMQRGQQKYQLIARSVWRVQEQERRRLARELHDGVGQNLTALKNALVQLAAEHSSESALSEPLQHAVELCAQSIADTRELSRLLRPQILDDLGLEAALNQLARMVSRTGPKVEMVCAAGMESVGSDLQTLVYRVVQEALNNVAKHANADHCSVIVGFGKGQLKLDIIDDGCGFDASQLHSEEGRETAFGTLAMRERVALFGGTLGIQSRPGEGTCVRARLPMATE